MADDIRRHQYFTAKRFWILILTYGWSLFLWVGLAVSHYCFRLWLVACPVPSHYLNQLWQVLLMLYCATRWVKRSCNYTCFSSGQDVYKNIKSITVPLIIILLTNRTSLMTVILSACTARKVIWAVDLPHFPVSNSHATSSNGNIFRVTGHLCGEFTGPRWIPHTKASDAELWCFLWSASE